MSTSDKIFWRIMIWVLGLSTPLMASLKPRRFIAGEIDFVESAKGLTHSVTIGLYLFFLVVAVVSFLARLSSNEKKMGTLSVLAFFLLFLLMALMPTVSSIISGGTVEMGILGALAIFSATYFLPVPEMDWWIRQVRVMLLIVYVYGSIVAALFFPEWAWDDSYAFGSALTVFPVRLFGTANHANVLASLVIFAWMLGRFPKCRLRGEFLHGCACLLVLVPTQSKTNMLIGLVLVGLYFLVKMASLSTVKRQCACLSLVLAVVSSALYCLNSSSYASRIEDFLYDPQVLTLTGRLPLWLFSVEMWLERPWLGQGIDAWSSEAVLDYVNILGWAAPHAHNQVFQVLSQTGLIGLAVFVAWLFVSLRMLGFAPVEWRKSLYWLTGFYFLNGMTEVVLQYKIGVGNTLLTWIVFTSILILSRSCHRHGKNELNP